MAQEVSLRTLFASTAYFEAELRTDADGKASVEIDMPENLTSFRIMAVAVDPEVHDRFGSGEASVRVRKTIMLRPSLPRFLNLGDQFEASVMVDNQSDSTQTILVGTRGLNVALPGATQTTVEIPPGDSREVRFPMAVERVGVMRLQFAALSNEGRDATEIEIPVLVPATKQAFADYGMTSSSVSRAVQVPKDALPGFGGLEVSMSSTALNGLEDAVDYLVNYRYECSEQTSSRILPIFALGDILDDFPVADVHDRARRDLLANDGIRKLFTRQNYDGGFGFWADERGESWPYVSTWVTFALLEGKRAGYAVDPDKLDRALRYLEDYVRYGHVTRWGVYYDQTTRAFALWLLASEDRGADLFDRVWAKRKQVPLYARALLASAAHRYGKQGPVDEVVAELRDLVVENARTIHFAESKSEAGSSEGLSILMHSNTQTDAIVLMTLLELGGEQLEDDGMAPKIMAGLMSDRDPKLGGRWSSTHTTAWALIAASRYYKVMEAETPNFTAKIWLDELFAGEQAFVGRDMAKVDQQIPMADLLGNTVERVTLAKDGPGKLYYRLGLRYAPADFKMKAVDRGFTVSRRYEAWPSAGEDKPDPEAVVQRDNGDWVDQGRDQRQGQLDPGRAKPGQLRRRRRSAPGRVRGPKPALPDQRRGDEPGQRRLRLRLGRWRLRVRRLRGRLPGRLALRLRAGQLRLVVPLVLVRPHPDARRSDAAVRRLAAGRRLHLHVHRAGDQPRDLHPPAGPRRGDVRARAVRPRLVGGRDDHRVGESGQMR